MSRGDERCGAVIVDCRSRIARKVGRVGCGPGGRGREEERVPIPNSKSHVSLHAKYLCIMYLNRYLCMFIILKFNNKYV
jgi:hypothetical protein